MAVTIKKIVSALDKAIAAAAHDVGQATIFKTENNYDRCIQIDSKVVEATRRGEYKDLRRWQLLCLSKQLEGNEYRQRFMTVAFCGSGKSMTGVASAIIDIELSGGTQRQLFLCPQSHQCAGFAKDKIFIPGIGEHDWESESW